MACWVGGGRVGRQVLAVFTMPGGQFYVTLQMLTITVYNVGLAGAAVLLTELLGVRRRARTPRRVLAQGCFSDSRS